ncbi:MAG: efflux RND transporter periplasmic adaptor subunit [Bacteroidota bacterium]
MKLRFITILLISIVFIACDKTDNIETKRKELSEAKDELFKLKEKISKIEKELVELGDVETNTSLSLVSTIKVNKEPFYHKVDIRGEVQSNNNVLISPETPSVVKRILVSEGQKVSEGQLLIVQDDEVLKKSIRELESGLELAVIIFEKQKKLWEQKIGTEVQYLTAKNGKESLELKLATTKSQLSKTRIRAPFDGVVDLIDIRVGEMAQPGFPVVRLVSNSNVYINADVSESYIGKFKEGQEVEIYFPSTDKIINSSIRTIGQVINLNNRTFELEVSIPDNIQVKPNMIAVLTLADYQNQDAISVPTRIIQTDRMGKYVYKVQEEEGKTVVKRVDVTPGMTYDNATEITSGLEGSELLVLKGGLGLADGAAVNVSNE